MTQADKTEISNLLASAGAMKHLANELNAPYNDAKIAEYAVAALKDAKETKEYVLSVLRDNLALFMDLNNIRIGGGCWGFEDVRKFNKERTVFYTIGNILHIKVRVDDFVQKPCNECGVALISAKPDDVEVVNVWIENSDTSLSAKKWGYNDSIYHYCSSNDLYFGTYAGADKDTIVKFNPKWIGTAKYWNYIRECADRTRAKADIMFKELKFRIAAEIERLKARANEIEDVREANAKVGAYVKIA